MSILTRLKNYRKPHLQRLGPASKNSPRSRPAPSPRPDSERPVLHPLDAVNLVVEDPHVAEAEMTHERRKGEPAVRVGAPRLHRVYRRRYVVEEEDGLLQEEGEVEVAPPPEQARGVFDIGEEDPASDEALDLERHAMEETARTAARAETPPLHARVIVDVPDDNPWA